MPIERAGAFGLAVEAEAEDFIVFCPSFLI